MWIVRLALSRPYTFVVVSILIVLLGALAILRTPTDIFPNIDIPVVSIIWTYNGMVPEDMAGRDSSAETDATLRAEILSYSRTRGLFAGVSLEGSTIRSDNGDNQRVYGRKIPARDIVLSGKVSVPPAAEQLISTLDAISPRHR